MSRHHHPKQPERVTCPLDRCACTRGEDGARCRQCSFEHHCGSHEDGCHRSCAGPHRARAGFRRFQGYRPEEPDRPNLGMIPPGPRFEGVVFSDGTTVIRWRGTAASTVVFGSFTAMMRVHGHPEYGTRIEWLDPLPEPVSPEKGALWNPGAAAWAATSISSPVTPGPTRSTSSRSPGG